LRKTIFQPPFSVVVDYVHGP